MAKWIKGFEPQVILDQVEESKSLDSSGNVSFAMGLGFGDSSIVLSSMLAFNDAVPEIEQRKIINKALSVAGKRGQLTVASFLKQVNVLEGDYLKVPPQRFCVVAQISIAWTIKLPKTRLDDSVLVFSNKIDKRFSKPREKIIENAKHSILGEFPRRYSYVKAFNQARSSEEAAQNGLDDIDFVRGIWNMFINKRTLMRDSSGRRDPVNKIVLGPIHTLHLKNGNKAGDSWWYEPQYQAPISPIQDEKKIEEFKKYYLSARKHMKGHPYIPELRRFVIRYTRALDTRDWEDAFIKLWGLLESLTHTLYDSYKLTIKRAFFPFHDRAYHKQVLIHLKNYRNRSVHVGAESHNIESMMYQLKKYVEALIEFHFAHGKKFGSLENTAKVMDLSVEKDELELRKISIDFARKYQYG